MYLVLFLSPFLIYMDLFDEMKQFNIASPGL